ncbi:MAG TPA: protein kinase [Labilithrix sp.]|nr:protein kinase [Labilithrix sp.]
MGLQGSESSSLTGRTIDRYLIEALIGRGGMGEVYRALDTKLRRKIALKVVRPDQDRPEGVERLFREARAAASLTHPNTVAIHDLGESDGLFYIVMELVNGMPLLAYVGDDRVPLARKLTWCRDIARALSSAHKAGVIHRDVKPSNVMVSEEGVAKVLDFGLAKPVEPQSFDFRTQIGQVVGTVRYMSPEQLAGAEADPRSDQYAFGVTTYELLSGRYPGGRPLGIPEPLDKLVPELTRAGARVIERTMRASPSDRFPSMDDVMVALDDVAKHRPVRVSLSEVGDDGPGTLPAPGERAVDPSVVADTVRAPETPNAPDAPLVVGGPSAAHGGEQPSTEPSGAPSSERDALARRQRAHLRAHEAARTVLSRTAPSGLVKAARASPGAPRTDRPTSVPPTLDSPLAEVLRDPVVPGAEPLAGTPPAALGPPLEHRTVYGPSISAEFRAARGATTTDTGGYPAEEQRSDATDIGGKTTGANRSVL